MHADRCHALLSASGASRWMNCTPSARLEDAQPRTTSTYAEEGTLAHEIAELDLQYFVKGKRRSATYKKALAKLTANPLYSQEMPREVTKYVDYCKDIARKAKTNSEGYAVEIESRLDFSHIVPEGFGTGDFLVIDGTTLHVIDLKYGKGVPVSADNNPQLMLYGIGALNKYDILYDIETVKLHVVQPRLDNVSVYGIPVEALVLWGDTYVAPKAQLAYNGEGEQVSGDWCRWCGVKATCRKLAEENLALAKHDFAEPMLLDDDELLEAYGQIAKLTNWANAVMDHMFQKALQGKDWPGYKLVEGRSNRKWADPEKAIKALSPHFDYTEITNTKIKGIGAISKLMSVDKFEKLLSKHIIKPPGAPTLVPESDKRDPIGLAQAKKDFA